MRPRRTSAPRGRPRFAPVGWCLLVLALSFAAVAVPQPAAAQGPEADVVLTAITPSAPNSGGNVRAIGRITNVSDVGLHEVQAAFWVDSNPLRNRKEITAAAHEQPGERLATRITEPYDLLDQVDTLLEPGESARFELDLPVEYLNLAGPGTYVVGADVRATVPPDGARETVGRVRTFLPMVSEEAAANPVELSMLVPLTAAPAFLDGGTLLDPAAAAGFGPDGRLRRLLELGARYDVTWLVDPALLELAEVLASGYQYADGTGPVDETAANHAREWLTLVDETLNESNTLWLPYADPDIMALQRGELADYYNLAVSTAQVSASNHGQSGLLPEPVPETTDSSDGSAGAPTPPTPETTTDPTESEAVAGTDESTATPDGDEPTNDPTDDPTDGDDGTDEGEAADDRRSAVFGLPGQAFADEAALETMAAAGAGGVILSAAELPGLPTDGTAPVASIATGSGALTALVTDTRLTAGGPDGKRRSLLTRQRLLAETATLAERGDSDEEAPRRLVVTLPRNWSPNRAGESLLQKIESTPWLDLVPASVPLAEAPVAYGGEIRYPKAAARAELDDASMAALQDFSVDSQDYLSMLAEPEDDQLLVSRDLLRGASMAWRRNGDRGIALLRAARSRFADAKNNLDVLSPRFVTLSSRSGSFPITIANENDFPVRVTVEVTSRSADRIEVAPLDPITIPPNRRETERPLVEVVRGGVVQLEVGLSTPAGTSFGQRSGFAVRATDYGLVGWGVLGVGFGLLALAMVLRIIRRLRARPAAGTA